MLRRFIVRPTSSVVGARGIVMTVPRYAPKTVPPLLETAFATRQYEQLLQKMPDWDKDFVGWPSHKIATELRDLGFPAPRGQMANAILAYLNDPLKVLREAEEKHDAAEWDFVHPHPPAGTVNKTTMDEEIGKSARDVADNIKLCTDPKGALLLVVQGGMGIGKSHVCDTIQEYVFQGQNPLVLKVTYNRRQLVRTEAERPAAGLLARLVLAVERRVPPTAYGVVQRALAADAHAAEDRKLTAARVAQYILEKANGRPVIVAVDELASLSSDESVLKEVLSAVAEFIKAVYQALGAQAKALALVTALPHTNITSLSERSPEFVTPIALTNDESRQLLQANVGAGPSAPDVDQMVLACGGHPRSLVVAASLYAQSKVVPLPATIASGCLWRPEQGCNASVVAEALAGAYRDRDLQPAGAMERLRVAAMLVERDGRWMVPPTVLFSDRKDRENLRHVRAIYEAPPGLDNTKLLEHIHRHWEYFKAERGLPVVPPRMMVEAPAGHVLPYDPRELRFRFRHDRDACDSNVLNKFGGLHPDFKRVDPAVYYCPRNESHRAIETMCVGTAPGAGTSPGTVEVLCLFQCKINGDARQAVDGLNSAAADLRPVWNGEFLFVVLALGASSEQMADAQRAAQHPTLAVNRESLADYFTATLAPAAELCLSRHTARQVAKK